MEWQIQHEAKPSAVFATRPPPLMLYFIVQHEYTVLLLICWFCMGGLLVLSSVIHYEELDSTLYECSLMRHDIHTSNNELNQAVQFASRPFCFEAMTS